MFFSKTSSLVAVLFAAGAFANTISFDPVYDNAGQSTDTVSCSNLTPQFPTFGSFPSFPNIGGASAVTGFASAACGSCWQITDPTTGVSIFLTAIDHAGDFTIAETAMNTLTNGQAEQLGVIQASAVQVDASNCGV